MNDIALKITKNKISIFNKNLDNESTIMNPRKIL